MKTKAAVLRELNKPLSVEYLEIPELKKGQVLVKVNSSGLCGSQINEIQGARGEDKFLPHLMGHEGYGTVVSVGEGVTKVKPQDEVVLTWMRGRGLEGGPKKYGECNAGAITTFQEYSVISENRLVLIPPNKKHKNAAIFGCMIPTGFGSIFNFHRGGTVRIFGSGSIGSAAILAARSLYVKVYAVDISEKKLEYAHQLGAEVVNLPDDKLDKVDLAVDTTGNVHSIENAFNSIKDDGTLVIVGNPVRGSTITLDPFEFIKGKRVVGSWGGNVNPEIDIPRFMNMNVSLITTNKYGLDDINKAIDDFKNGICGKILIEG